MRKKMIAMSAAAVLLGCAVQMQARTTRIVGVIAGVERHAPLSMRLTSHGAEDRTVRTDENTAYMKWVTHKPWQGGALTDVNALVLGRCAEIELGANDIAKVVRVSDEPAGSVYDPCMSRR